MKLAVMLSILGLNSMGLHDNIGIERTGLLIGVSRR